MTLSSTTLPTRCLAEPKRVVTVSLIRADLVSMRTSVEAAGRGFTTCTVRPYGPRCRVARYDDTLHAVAWHGVAIRASLSRGTPWQYVPRCRVARRSNTCLAVAWHDGET